MTATPREPGRGPLGAPGAAGSPDALGRVVRTPGLLGVNDRTAALTGANGSAACPSTALEPIWGKLTPAERDCVLEHRNLWKRLVDGTDSQHTYALYAGFFEKIGASLFGEDSEPAERESAFTLLDRIYTKLCRHEYERIDGELKKAFEDQSKENRIRPAWRYYRVLRAGYVKAGFTSPIEAFKGIDPHVQFLGKPVWKGLHQDLIALLERVESRLKQDGQLDNVTSGLRRKHWGGFVPRFIAGTASISKHSIGLAIDIDFPTNPHIKGPVASAIDAILDHLSARGTRVPGRIRQVFKGYGDMSMEDYDRLKAISDAIVAFLNEWLPKWDALQAQLARDANLSRMSMPDEQARPVSEPPEFLVRDKQTFDLFERLIKAWGGVDKARFHAKHGLVTLDAALFRAMKSEGVESGIEWQRHKDIMHFELPGSLKRWAKTKGYTKPAD